MERVVLGHRGVWSKRASLSSVPQHHSEADAILPSRLASEVALHPVFFVGAGMGDRLASTAHLCIRSPCMPHRPRVDFGAQITRHLSRARLARHRYSQTFV